jgi:dephospho-CoA kinase
VAEIFSKLGAEIIDTDAIAHQLTAVDQSALAGIEALFGTGIMAADGRLDRNELRHLVFNDAVAKKALEDFLHPLIHEQVIKTLSQPSSSSYRIVVVPLLFETNAYQRIIQRSLVVDCAEELQLQRALSRGTFSEAEIRAVMAVQCTRQQRLAAADDVIVNGGEYERLQEQVESLHKKYLSLA